jgi:hypothetical protein
VCIVGSKKQKARKEHEINEGKKRTNVNPTFSPIGPSDWTKYTHCSLPEIAIIIIIITMSRKVQFKGSICFNLIPEILVLVLSPKVALRVGILVPWVLTYVVHPLNQLDNIWC